MQALVLVLAALGLGAPAAAQPGAAPERSADYDVRSRAWNGLSELAALSVKRCPLVARRVLDWDALTGHDVLFFAYPQAPIDEAALVAFLGAGGRLVLADDYGRGDGALRALGIDRRPPPIWSSEQRRHRDNAALPIAQPLRATALAQGSPVLIANHPAIISGRRAGLPSTYAFLSPPMGAALDSQVQELGLVIEGVLGRGRFVALSDPSVFINNMLELPGNLAFAERLIAELCRPAPGGDRLLLFHGAFTQRGFPPAVLLGAPSSGGVADLADLWNRALSGANLHIQEALSAPQTRLGLDIASLCGLVLALAALALALRYLPLSAAPHDQGFAQAPRALEGGLFALVERYSQRQVPWGFLYPAALLREEVLRRLFPHLATLVAAAERRRGRPQGPPLLPTELLTSSEVAAAVTQGAGPAAGRAAALLWQELRVLPATPAGRAWISARQLRRLHQHAAVLFAALAEPSKVGNNRATPL